MTRSRRSILAAAAFLVLVAGYGAGGAARGQEPEPVLRLTVAVEDGEWTLLRAEELEMVLPLTAREQVLAAGELPAGYALDLLGSDEASLLRVGIPDPTLTVAEYEDPETPGRIVREEVRQRQTTFSILVPAPAGARYLRLTRPAEGQWLAAPEDQQREELGLFELPRK